MSNLLRILMQFTYLLLWQEAWHFAVELKTLKTLNIDDEVAYYSSSVIINMNYEA